jgi:hypothetical protein
MLEMEYFKLDDLRYEHEFRAFVNNLEEHVVPEWKMIV